MVKLAVRIATLDQLLDALDGLFDDGSDWTRRAPEDPWKSIFSQEHHPLNSSLPDANLVCWRTQGLLPPGEDRTALDVGCGLGRNTHWLAQQGYQTTGIDLSAYALQQARERFGEANTIFIEGDVLREQIPGGPFDVVYDSGCFHHLPPHRRLSYLRTLGQVVKPGGWFGICTFAWGEMGSEEDDATLLRRGQLEGGIAYSMDDLRQIFSALEFVAGDRLEAGSADPASVFQMPFLHAALFRRPEAPLGNTLYLG